MQRVTNRFDLFHTAHMKPYRTEPCMHNENNHNIDNIIADLETESYADSRFLLQGDVVELTVPDSQSSRSVARVVIEDNISSPEPPANHEPAIETLIRTFSNIAALKTTNEYILSLATLFIFYSLPVFQLLLTHLGLVYKTGNEDLCFYNFSCANRLGVLSDFNHIISNAGYIILGIFGKFLPMGPLNERNILL